MYDRFTDTEARPASEADFVVRQRIPPLWQLTIAFLAVFFGIVLMANAFPDSVRNPVFLVMVFILVGLLGWFTLFFTQRNRDMVIATEFQNALFSSAARINTRFCVITKKDGSIVYYDPGFQTMFPDFVRMENRAIDMLLEMGGASKADQDKIFSALDRGVYDRLVLSLAGSDGAAHKFVLTIDPLPRPEGFFLFRGREFVEQRTNREADNASAPPAFVANLLHSIPVGLYASGADGQLQFVNRTLERWLGYNEGEMLARRLTLQDILTAESSHDGASAIRWEDFQGDVDFRTRSGEVLRTHVTQEVLRESGRIAGATGTVERHDLSMAENQSLKKKLSTQP